MDKPHIKPALRRHNGMLRWKAQYRGTTSFGYSPSEAYRRMIRNRLQEGLVLP